MLKNYLKIAFRSLFKYKTFSIINLLGLAVGFTCFLMIALWIKDELSYDQFHEFEDRLYAVMENQHYSSGEIFTTYATPGVLGEALKEDIPELTYATTMDWWTNTLVSYENKHIKEQGRYVGEDFLKMFSFPLAKGDKETALSEPTSMVISQKLADKFFPGIDPIGKTLRISDRFDHQVTGVLENLPTNSIFKFDYLLPLQAFLDKNAWARKWNNNGLRTFVMLEEEADYLAVNAKIKDVLKARSEQDNTELFIQPIADVYLRNDFKNGVYQGGGRIQYVRLFGIIALLVLLIAGINFMNLSTARASVRAKEVGIRKVVGANRKWLSLQFLGEAALVCLMAMGLSLVAVDYLLPWFNQFTGKEVLFPFMSASTWWGLGAMVLVMSLLAGSYPAFILSAFQPVKVLKGQLDKTPKGAWIRKGLVVAQFSIAAFLIIGMLVVQGQLSFLQNKNLGYEKEQLVLVTLDKNLQTKYPALKADLQQLPEIQSVSASHSRITGFSNSSSNFNWEGKNPEEDHLFVYETVKPDYLATIGAELLEGRDFSTEHPADSANFILNESAVQLMDLETPYVGQRMTAWQQEGQIVGVVKDFNFSTLKEPVEPLVLTMSNSHVWTMYLRINGQQTMQILSDIEAHCKKYSSAYLFQYDFADEAYNRLYKSEQVVSRLSIIFALLAIFISCLGLFGLSTFTAERRIKEIGIRRVLGASVGGIVGLLSKDFLKPVLIALVIAAPFAWYFMKNWLNDFAYHIQIGWQVFVIAAVLAIGIALITVSFQSIKAALANPINALRRE